MLFFKVEYLKIRLNNDINKLDVNNISNAGINQKRRRFIV